MGDIGKTRKWRELEPLPEQSPVDPDIPALPESEPVPEQEPEQVPA